MSIIQARRWFTGVIFMAICIALMRLFDLGADAMLLIGWLGGAMTVLLYPDTRLETQHG